MLSSVYVVHSSIYVVHSSVYAVLSSVCAVHSSVYAVHSSVYVVHSSPCEIFATVFCIRPLGLQITISGPQIALRNLSGRILIAGHRDSC